MQTHPLDHADYRSFLRAWLAEARGEPSLRGLARRAGCSPALISSILAGTRDLDGKRVGAFTRALELDEDAGRAFAALVECEEGATLRSRRRAAGEVEAARRFRRAHRLEDPTARLFSEWYLQAIAELARVPGFRDDPAWIATALCPPIEPDEAAEGLATLEDLGVLVRRGHLVPAPPESWATSPNVPPGELAQAVGRHHAWTARRAEEALRAFPPKERDVSAVVLSLSATGRARLRDLVRQFQEDVIGLSETDPGPREQVHTVAVHVFPLSVAPER